MVSGTSRALTNFFLSPASNRLSASLKSSKGFDSNVGWFDIRAGLEVWGGKSSSQKSRYPAPTLLVVAMLLPSIVPRSVSNVKHAESVSYEVVAFTIAVGVGTH